VVAVVEDAVVQIVIGFMAQVSERLAEYIDYVPEITYSTSSGTLNYSTLSTLPGTVHR